MKEQLIKRDTALQNLLIFLQNKIDAQVLDDKKDEIWVIHGDLLNAVDLKHNIVRSDYTLEEYIRYLDHKGIIRLRRIYTSIGCMSRDDFYDETVRRYTLANFAVTDRFFFGFNRKAMNKIMQEMETVKDHNRKITLIFSERDGITLEGNEDLSYPVRRGSKRFKVIKNLIPGWKDGALLLDACGYKDMQILSKEIQGINKVFKKSLKLKKDLIIHEKTGGYTINPVYEIV